MGGRTKDGTFSHHLGCCWSSGSFHRDTAAYALLSSKKAQESSWRSACVGFVDSPPTSATDPAERRPVLYRGLSRPSCARPRWRVVCAATRQDPGRRAGTIQAPRPQQAGEEEVRLRWGSPPGSHRRGHTPVGANVTLWDFSKRRLVCGKEGDWVGAPF